MSPENLLLCLCLFLTISLLYFRVKKELDRFHERKQSWRYYRGIEDFTQNQCDNVVLSPNQVYLFESSSVGRFHIRGGFTGNITVDGRVVTIWDDQKNVLFECGEYSGRVEIKDIAKDGNTTVKLIHNGAKIHSNFDMTNDDLMIIHYGKIRVNLEELSSDDHENPGTLQIVGYPGEDTIIAGHRPVVVTGNGGFLIKLGTNSVIVRGNPQIVAQQGTSTIIVNGNVMDDVIDGGIGSINIEGDVYGSVATFGFDKRVSEGSLWKTNGFSRIIIGGNVHGDIHCKEFGSVEVLGSHLNGGKVIIEDYGHVAVDGHGTTSLISKLLRFV